EAELGEAVGAVEAERAVVGGADAEVGAARALVAGKLEPRIHHRLAEPAALEARDHVDVEVRGVRLGQSLRRPLRGMELPGAHVPPWRSPPGPESRARGGGHPSASSRASNAGVSSAPRM